MTPGLNHINNIIMAKTTKKIDFESITLRIDASRRGGGIEISLDTLGFPGFKMTAYQNHLGGGMLGRICNDCNHPDWRPVILTLGSQQEKNANRLGEIAQQLARYFHAITNDEVDSYDEWSSGSFDQVQSRPARAY